MIIKTIKYTDYNDVERTEDFRFHLNKAELTEMEHSIKGGLSSYIKKLSAETDQKEIISIFKDIIQRSYGVKSDDGIAFIKNEEVLTKFMQSEAYSALFMELATDSEKAAEFFNGLMPKQ